MSLGSELSGIVRKGNVDVNDQVKKGEVLIELDDTKLKASVERAKASLDLSKATLAESLATLKEAKAKLSRLQEVRRLSGGK
ncbi:biotin/lipoyl-binding protein, partial [Acinetobacter baumannii]|uniref:biotin/lipoyl-binding protein n=1 Tax=Acinetobacter baumannii TaxID=470 RepID=UPI00331FEC3F